MWQLSVGSVGRHGGRESVWGVPKRPCVPLRLLDRLRLVYGTRALVQMDGMHMYDPAGVRLVQRDHDRACDTGRFTCAGNERCLHKRRYQTESQKKTLSSPAELVL